MEVSLHRAWKAVEDKPCGSGMDRASSIRQKGCRDVARLAGLNLCRQSKDVIQEPKFKGDSII